MTFGDQADWVLNIQAAGGCIIERESTQYRMVEPEVIDLATARATFSPPERVRSEQALLTTIVTRLCLNELKSAHKQRESYLGPWLPEPLLTSEHPELADPEQHASACESISLAFLVLLESLQPAERAVFLLHDVFDYGYPEIARIIGKSEPACRQLLSRAKRHLAAHRPQFKSTPEHHRHLLEEFLRASQASELDGLMHLLTEDVTLWADGNGKVKGAALRPVRSRKAVARFLLGTRRFAPEGFVAEVANVNGEPAAILRHAGRAFLVATIEPSAQGIRAIPLIANPEKLTHL
jgi:RNA polymerase sigma-70 factor (ECF subfamily)